MGDVQPITAEGRLLRYARSKAMPHLSMRAAAAKAGVSEEAWGYAERGYLPARGGAPRREFHPPAAKLARMFSALGTVTPRQVEERGERPDAAALMDEPAAAPGSPRLSAVPERSEPGPGDLPETPDEQLVRRVIQGNPVLEGIMGLKDGDGNLRPWAERRELMIAWLERRDQDEEEGSRSGNADRTAGSGRLPAVACRTCR